MFSLLKNEEGFSVADGVVASVMVLLMAVSFIPAFVFNSQTSAKAKEKTIAASLARREAEKVKTAGDATESDYAQVSEAPNFGFEKEVALIPSAPGMKEVTIKVYKDSSGNPGKLLSTFTFYIYPEKGI